uniref:Reverse transcriptase domain-containing protein n=1 Tax=Amphimedon queenslandica TaxID=400682 RepID=A0A1X7UU72_AMPQE
VYIDDVLVASSDEAEHKNHLTQIFNCFKDYEVFINPDKYMNLVNPHYTFLVI